MIVGRVDRPRGRTNTGLLPFSMIIRSSISLGDIGRLLWPLIRLKKEEAAGAFRRFRPRGDRCADRRHASGAPGTGKLDLDAQSSGQSAPPIGVSPLVTHGLRFVGHDRRVKRRPQRRSSGPGLGGISTDRRRVYHQMATAPSAMAGKTTRPASGPNPPPVISLGPATV